MSNVISFSDFKEKKLKDKIEQELSLESDMLSELLMDNWFSDDVTFTTCTTTTITISVDGDIIFSSDEPRDEE